jgi:hypothetical protein
MGKASSETKQYEHNRGEKDASEGHTGTLSGPWRGIFESSEHFDDRQDAYNAGMENYHNSKK